MPSKKLIKVGYFRLDELPRDSEIRTHRPKTNKQPKLTTVLLAPTWGENSILPICGEKIIDILLQSGYRVITRLHPEATRKSPELDVDPSADFWMQQASLMISDWSGVVMEYAYGFEKPVLFIDLPRKINNPAYSQLGIEPMELSVRNEIGKVVHSEKSLSFQPK